MKKEEGEEKEGLTGGCTLPRKVRFVTKHKAPLKLIASNSAFDSARRAELKSAIKIVKTHDPPKKTFLPSCVSVKMNHLLGLTDGVQWRKSKEAGRMRSVLRS
jgi:hypothetical protein